MEIHRRTVTKTNPCRKSPEMSFQDGNELWQQQLLLRMTLFSPLWSHFRVIMPGTYLRSLFDGASCGTVGQWLKPYWSGGASLPTQPGVCQKMIKLAWCAALAKLWVGFFVCVGFIIITIFNMIFLPFVRLQINCLMICSRMILGFEVR